VARLLLSPSGAKEKIDTQGFEGLLFLEGNKLLQEVTDGGQGGEAEKARNHNGLLERSQKLEGGVRWARASPTTRRNRSLRLAVYSPMAYRLAFFTIIFLRWRHCP